MNSKRILIYIITTLIAASATAQKEKLKFNSFNSAGIVAGENGVYPVFESINGLWKKDWFTGIGTGIDYYPNLRSVPIFIDVKKNIYKNFFINIDAGYNFPWVEEKYKITEISKFYGGLYYELNAGYKIILKQCPNFIVEAGYSYKNLKETRDYITSEANLNYKMRRIIIKVGIVL